MAQNKDKPSIVNITHPVYDAMLPTWAKFRLTYEGGEAFREKYLEKLSSRENNADFEERKAMSYVPAHAKAAINDVKNAIFQRLIDITRKDGPKSYQEAVAGQNGGVDLLGNTMDGFIGRLVLPELLTMAKVGVYIDKESVDEISDIRTHDAVCPYLYMYKAEEIRSWSYDSKNQLASVLLIDNDDILDDEYGLISNQTQHYRLLRMTEKGVEIRIFDAAGEESQDTVYLNLPKIPFTIMDLNSSLLTDIADYQIALLNMSSGDVNYAFRSNFPFYTEQYLPQAEMSHLLKANSDVDNKAGTAQAARVAKDKEITVGATKGRRYAKGLERPEFIHPSPEPLLASIKKQEKMKEEIRQLINLAITNIEPRRASAESKTLDEHGLESGLSYIGLELEYGERFIANIWGLYESRRSPNIATVFYPKKYSLKTDADRLKEGTALTKQAASVPSITYQREVLKKVAEITMGYSVSESTLNKIREEINKTMVVIMDRDTIDSDLENGLVSKETASVARLYPKDEVKKAAKEHAERLARIAVSQTEGAAAARGIQDQDPEGQQGAIDEKASVKQKVKGDQE